MEPLTATIDTSKLTLEDWLLIAAAKDNAQNWGFYGWLENCDKDALGDLTRKQIEAIADRLSSDSSWVLRKINEYC